MQREAVVTDFVSCCQCCDISSTTAKQRLLAMCTSHGAMRLNSVESTDSYWGCFYCVDMKLCVVALPAWCLVRLCLVPWCNVREWLAGQYVTSLNGPTQAPSTLHCTYVVTVPDKVKLWVFVRNFTTPSFTTPKYFLL